MHDGVGHLLVSGQMRRVRLSCASAPGVQRSVRMKVRREAVLLALEIVAIGLTIVVAACRPTPTATFEVVSGLNEVLGRSQALSIHEADHEVRFWHRCGGVKAIQCFEIAALLEAGYCAGHQGGI